MYNIDNIHNFRGMGANTVHMRRHVKKQFNHLKCF